MNIGNCIKILGVSLCAIGSVYGAEPQEPTFLDAQYKGLQHPKIDDRFSRRSRPGETVPFFVEFRSDSNDVIHNQSPVRSQGTRGTCSIFSAIAMLESMMIIRNGASPTIDLSEEWLEYLVTHNAQDDGSSSSRNFSLLARYGSPDEATFPYIGESWESVTASPLAQTRCGKLVDLQKRSCLLAHRDPSLFSATDQQLTTEGSDFYDPSFAKARQEATLFRTKNIRMSNSSFRLTSTSQIKTLLQLGVPVSLDFDFFYGSWNHRLAPELGMKRDMDSWNKGIVGYPEPGSVDRSWSPRLPAGHSVVLVGYDDSVIVSTRVLMLDGSEQDFDYQGVYYFKNSWGTTAFGSSFQLDGVPHPGYGMITQKYAHEFGGFYQFPLQ